MQVIRNQNIVTRFVSEFGLEQEVLQLQNSVNGVILSINNFLGEGPPDQKIDKIGTVSNQASAPTEAPAGGGLAGVTSLLTSIPEAVGAAAVAAIKFITPSAASSGKKLLLERNENLEFETVYIMLRYWATKIDDFLTGGQHSARKILTVGNTSRYPHNGLELDWYNMS